MNCIRLDHESLGDVVSDLRNPRYRMAQVEVGGPLGKRFDAIRLNYQALQRMVDDGAASWLRTDPYLIADWAPMFSPIERMTWGEIRQAGLPLLPQFSIGPYFADFVSPTVKVVLECDGAEFHDAAKDAKRDRFMADLGWTVYRATGAVCNRILTHPCDLPDDQYPSPWYREKYWGETIRGIIEQIKHRHFSADPMATPEAWS